MSEASDNDRAVAEGLLVRLYEGMSDDDMLAYVAEALAAEREKARAPLPQADLIDAYRDLERIVTAFMLGDVNGAAVAQVQQRIRKAATQ